MSENKKVKNANPTLYDNIQFKSEIEVRVYKTLKENGFNPQYEPTRFMIWEGFRPTVPYYTLNKKKENILNLKRLINITWKPDFVIEYEGLHIIMEVKGSANDVFPYKLKLFRKYIEELPDKEDFLIFEIFTKKQLLECIPIIKSYAASRKDKKISMESPKE
jgi:hypothetical protein